MSRQHAFPPIQCVTHDLPRTDALRNTVPEWRVGPYEKTAVVAVRFATTTVRSPWSVTRLRRSTRRAARHSTSAGAWEQTLAGQPGAARQTKPGTGLSLAERSRPWRYRLTISDGC